MNEETFVSRHDADWKRMSELCDRAEGGVKRLSTGELREFVRLYRRVSTDLSAARTRSSNLALIEFLNDLAGRAYGVLYREPRKSILRVLIHSIAVAAQTVRRRRAFVFTSAFLLFFPAFGAYFLLNAVPDLHSYLVPPSMESSFEMWKSGRFEERTGSQGISATGLYLGNNPKAAMVTGAVGAGTFGLMSVYLVITNGALIGTLAHEVAPLGHLDFLLSSLVPHGVPELSGLIISGAAGLLMGYALINPGRRTRAEALREVGRDAVTLLLTSVVLMFIAAPIEGFFSFNPHVPGYAKLIFGGVSICAWLLFWSGYGKDDVAPS